MKVEITLTRDDGTRLQLFVAEEVSKCWALKANKETIQDLSVSEAWAASVSCGELLLRGLPLDPSNQRLVRAVGAYHGDRIGPWDEDP